MKKRALQFAIGLIIISNGAFAQQSWSGNDLNTATYRNGSVGIGTAAPIGHLSFGSMGTHLSIVYPGFTNNIILATGWDNQKNQDFTEIRVPGATPNNTALLRLQSNGNLGLGISTMYEKFQIGSRFLFHDGGSKKICYNSYYDPNIGGIRRVEDAPVAEMSFTADGSILFGTAPTGVANSIVNNYLYDLYISNTGNVGIGTITPGFYKLAVEGKIAARGVKVTLAGFADYVFDSTYQLRPLASLQNYINQNKHLPGIPSAEEVKKDGGIELGEMNVKLLEKIEELTLYVIELKKEVEQLKKGQH